MLGKILIWLHNVDVHDRECFKCGYHRDNQGLVRNQRFVLQRQSIVLDLLPHLFLPVVSL
jgi:Zn ribbon nucleic-acid-binding protein